MPYHYTDPSRERDATALPDVEVFHNDGQDFELSDGEEGDPAGWYAWSCQPGCLPDGEAEGPYDSEAAVAVGVVVAVGVATCPDLRSSPARTPITPLPCSAQADGARPGATLYGAQA